MDTVEKTTSNHADESLGQYLSRMRKKKNIDLKNIAVTTRINYGILSDLERDHFENLPNRIYLRGFIRSLAKEISADEEYALTLLDRHLRPSPSRPPHPEHSNPPPSPPTPLNSTLNKDFSKLENLKKHYRRIPVKYLIAGLVVLTALGTGGLLLSKIFIATNQEAQKFLEKEEETQISEKQQTEEEQIMVEGKNPEEKSALIKDEAPQVKEETAPVSDEHIVQTSLMPVVLSKMEYPLYNLDPNHPKLRDKSLLPQRIREAYRPGHAHVFINAVNGASWMVYKNSGNPVRSFTLQKGKTLFLRGKEIRIFLGNLSAVEIFYNNQYLQTQSENQIRSLIFPHELAKKSEIPFFVYNKEEGKHYAVEDILKNIKQEKTEQEQSSP